jgi:hypothetical protein
MSSTRLVGQRRNADAAVSYLARHLRERRPAASRPVGEGSGPHHNCPTGYFCLPSFRAKRLLPLPKGEVVRRHKSRTGEGARIKLNVRSCPLFSLPFFCVILDFSPLDVPRTLTQPFP